MEQGTVLLVFDSPRRLDAAEMREAVEDAGHRLRGVRLTVRGTLERLGAAWGFTPVGGGARLPVRPAREGLLDEATAARGPVLISGSLEIEGNTLVVEAIE